MELEKDRNGRGLTYAASIAGIIVPLLVIFSGCRDGRTDVTAPLMERLSSAHTGIDFVNEVREADGLSVVSFESFYNGAGVGIGDINNDGRPDVFLASNMGESRLYLNEGKLVFTDVTREAGINTAQQWTNGVAMVDINDDGHLDIYLSCGGPYSAVERRANLLYVNNGDGTFEEMAADYGLADTGITTQAAFFDYDLDGDLDVYLLTNGIGETGPNVIVLKKVNGESVNTDRLYRNEGAGRFVDVSREANILKEGYGLGIVIFDVDRDGWDDVYVANDYLSNDLLYVNNQDGTFTDRASEAFRHQSYASMGTDVADFNNDGLLDIVTVDMLPAGNRGLKQMYGDAGHERQRSEIEAGYDRQLRRNTLQLNNGAPTDENPSFSDISHLAGVSSTGWSWSSLFADIDNDGRRDLMITNGLPRDITNLDFGAYKMQRLRSGTYGGLMLQDFTDALAEIEPMSIRNYFFRNDGNLSFSDQSFEWGFRESSYSNGAAIADLDDDGDLDLVINNINSEAHVFRNNASELLGRSYLKVALEGPPGNSSGLGARITVYSGNRSQYHEHTFYRGYLSTTASDAHFGLDAASAVDSVIVTWPDGNRQQIRDVGTNQTLVARYDAASAPDDMRPMPSDVLFADAESALEGSYRHQEAHYDDFKLQPLLPHKFSQSGPGLAVGDVNGDGRDDFYVGGAFSQSGRIYLQSPDGTFRDAGADEGLQTDLSGPKYYEEDMGSLFFDANGDGHLDLYVVSGGSEFEAGSEYYQDRLYLGDGSGNFQHDVDALPAMKTSGSAVAAADFDRDGDLDLFVGGRVVPNRYPEAPRSYILENREGRFVDITRESGPSLVSPGLVTGAIWSDFNDDGWEDLVVVGEWMPISFFENRAGHLVDVTAEAGTDETVGWWNSIAAGDFDRDGDTDYVAGNLGLNTNLQNRAEGPVRAYVNDFNRDGRIEAMLSRFTDGANYPVHLRDDLLAQNPRLIQHYPTYESYAQATIDDLLSVETHAGTRILESNTFATSHIENLGASKFSVAALPVEAQFAPVFGILSGDFDADGMPDLLMIGNSYASEAFVGPYDAFSGLMLHGDGGGAFSAARASESGFLVDGDGKALAEISGADGERLIVASQNGDRLRAIRPPNSAHALRIRPDELRAEIAYEDGEQEKVEFYRGSGYLSQSSRVLHVSPHAVEIRLFTADALSRTWSASEPEGLTHADADVGSAGGRGGIDSTTEL